MKVDTSTYFVLIFCLALFTYIIWIIACNSFYMTRMCEDNNIEYDFR